MHVGLDNALRYIFSAKNFVSPFRITPNYLTAILLHCYTVRELWQAQAPKIFPRTIGPGQLGRFRALRYASTKRRDCQELFEITAFPGVQYEARLNTTNYWPQTADVHLPRAAYRRLAACLHADSIPRRSEKHVYTCGHTRVKYIQTHNLLASTIVRNRNGIDMKSSHLTSCKPMRAG